MSDPRRFVDAEPDDPAQRLFRSMLDDAPPPEARQRTLAAVGALGVVTTASNVAPATKTVAGLSRLLVLGKWVGLAIVGGGLAAGAASLLSSSPPPLSVSPSALASTHLLGPPPGSLASPPRLAPPPSDSAAALAIASGAPVGSVAVLLQEATSVTVAPPLSPPPADAASWPLARSLPGTTVSTTVAAAPRPDLPAAAPLPAGVPSAALSSPAAAPLASASPPVRASSMVEEIAALDRVRARLSSGDGPGALGALEAYRTSFPRGHLSAEATVLRIEALGRTGDRAGARSLALSFLAAHPRSPLGPRVRSLVDIAP